MKVTFLGHATFLVEAYGYRVIIDPFLTGNPQFMGKLSDIPKIDAVILSHGHDDHVGDTLAIAERDDALVIGMVELLDHLQDQSRYKMRTHGMGIGGRHQFPFGSVYLTPAIHSSSRTLLSGDIVYLGLAAGIVLEMGDKKLYHAGDTALFSDMQLLARYELDVALLPIGDNYTMGIADSIVAAQWIKAKQVIPMHYNTFELINQNVLLWADEMIEAHQMPTILMPSEFIEV